MYVDNGMEEECVLVVDDVVGTVIQQSTRGDRVYAGKEYNRGWSPSV